MEAVGSTRLGRASSRYGAPAVFSGPVRKWEKKWVHVIPSSSLHNNNSNSHSQNNNNNNNNASSRLLLRRWTPISAPSSAPDDDDTHNVSDEPPRRKFRYTPIAVLEEQKKGVVEKVEHEPTTESDQLTAGQTNVTHEVDGKLNMNDISEDTKDSNMSKLDLDLGFQGNSDENSPHSDDQLEDKIPVAAS